MKQLLYSFGLSIFFFLIAAPVTMAQSCGSSSASECTPNPAASQTGFPSQDSTPCIIQGTDYDYTVQFRMFDVFNFMGAQNVDSIEFDKIENLPCGICWSSNKANNRFSSNEYGCLRLRGNSTDAVGQYKLAVTLRAWINGNPGIPVVPTLVDGAGIRIYVRVAADANNCPAVDTSSGAANQTANPANCPSSVQEQHVSLSGLTIAPNPLNQSAVVSFASATGGECQVRIADLAGRVLRDIAVNATTGSNLITIHKNDLPAGVYVLSVSDGAGLLNKRFSIVE